MYHLRLRDVMGKNRKKTLKVPPSTTVAEAARKMEGAEVGAVLVVDGERLVGIFTERDAVTRVLAGGLDPQATAVAAVMTSSPLSLPPERPFGAALALMHREGFRHVPVVEDGKVIGMVFARNALDPDMEDFIAEARRRDHYAAVA
jgi:CBS domain-containing protein